MAIATGNIRVEINQEELLENMWGESRVKQALGNFGSFYHEIDEIKEFSFFDRGITPDRDGWCEIRYTVDWSHISHGWCQPSREDLLTGVKWETGRSGRWNINDPEVIPVEEDSVFAPRKVEVECVA